MLHDGDTFEHDGRTFRFRTEWDDCGEAPWERCEGHGPVTDWTTRDKRPGEMILNSDGRSRRFYDFAEAVRIARRDNWGWLPGRLAYWQNPDGTWSAHVAPHMATPARYEATRGDVNAAISAVYAAHRATMTPRAYAAGAAMRDFERLRDWCNDGWHYVGVVVELLDLNGKPTGRDASLWGIESDAGDYFEEVAREIAGEIDFPRVVYVPGEVAA